jgi:L-asparaginase
MKKILVIGYGGTIVMVVDEKRKAIVPAKSIEEIKKFLPNLKGIADITMEFLSNKDSTNIGPEDWTRLAIFIKDNHDKYDGFVITHGTNTMAYTASALDIALGAGLKKPVVITGSQLPLTVYGNDARFNFENAVKTAVEASELGISEVMIVFNDLVLRGSRSLKVSESSFDAFQSPAFPELAKITSTGIHFNSIADKVNPKIPFDINPHFFTNIISLDLTPGLNPSLVETIVKYGKCRGVILKSFGAGSVPSEGEFSFLPAIKRIVQDYKTPVVVSTKFLGGNSMKDINDEPAIQAIAAGAIPAGDMTDVMTEVKLMWILAQGNLSAQNIKAQIHKSYVGEISVRK